MISVIITARREEKTIGRAIEAFLGQDFNDDFEILVVAPDRETLKAAKAVSKKVKFIQDTGRGKAHAMNLAIKEAQGDILIFSDGDVEVGHGAVKELLKVGGEAAAGRPVPLQLQFKAQSSPPISSVENPRSWKADQLKAEKFKVIFDFWQYVLFDTAHELRLERDKKNQFLLISGYLFLIKKGTLNNFKFPEYLLTEDEYLSYWLWQKGIRVRYADRAVVKVKYPDNYSDWLKQKVRTLAGGYQIAKEWKKKVAMRGFWRESLGSMGMWLKYVRSLKQALWIALLFAARLQAWFLAFIKVRLLGQTRDQVWQRVESTK